MAHNPLLAAEYRERAAAERAAGEASGLEQVRAKHEEAARVWTGLADAEDARRAEALARQRQGGPEAG
jgi:hypothetical protein